MGRRTYTHKISSSEVELEHGTGWKNSYSVHHGGENINNVSAGASANHQHIFQANSGEEHLRGVEANENNGGIWKSTSVVVSRGRK